MLFRVLVIWLGLLGLVVVGLGLVRVVLGVIVVWGLFIVVAVVVIGVIFILYSQLAIIWELMVQFQINYRVPLPVLS